jgi:hypothetical protein
MTLRPNGSVGMCPSKLARFGDVYSHTVNTAHGYCGSPFIVNGVVIGMHVGFIQDGVEAVRNIMFPLPNTFLARDGTDGDGVNFVAESDAYGANFRPRENVEYGDGTSLGFQLPLVR